MAMLTTDRLFLLPVTRTMMTTRLERDDFALDCETPDGIRTLHFGPEFPGGALGLYVMRLRDLGDEDEVAGTFAIVDRASGEVVGEAGTKGGVQDGVVEIGYGMNESVWGTGVATEAIAAFTEHLLSRPDVARVTAQTAVDNVGSRRVLEKNGFTQDGTDWYEGDGDLLCWTRS